MNIAYVRGICMMSRFWSTHLFSKFRIFEKRWFWYEITAIFGQSLSRIFLYRGRPKKRSNLEGIGALCDKYGALCCVDSVKVCGGVPLSKRFNIKGNINGNYQNFWRGLMTSYLEPKQVKTLSSNLFGSVSYKGPLKRIFLYLFPYLVHFISGLMV